MELNDNHPAQQRVDTMLRRAVVLSILWLMGIGSFVAVTQAARALRMINASGGQSPGWERSGGALSWAESEFSFGVSYL